MDINNYIQKIIQSTGNDWHNIPCWGNGSGPSYKDHFEFYNIYDGQENIILHKSHGNRATYKPDVKISIAWGLDHSFDEDVRQKHTDSWATNFSDSSGASISFVDFFYNDSLVFRKEYGTVDGGRCKLPIPHLDSNGNFVASQEYSEAMRVLNEIEGGVDFADYLRRSGITLNNESILD